MSDTASAGRNSTPAPGTYDTTSATHTVTELITWTPTDGGGRNDAGSTSKSAASDAPVVAFTVGAEKTMCYGRGPCRNGAERVVPMGFTRDWGLGLVLMVMVMVMV